MPQQRCCLPRSSAPSSCIDLATCVRPSSELGIPKHVMSIEERKAKIGQHARIVDSGHKDRGDADSEERNTAICKLSIHASLKHPSTLKQMECRGRWARGPERGRRDTVPSTRWDPPAAPYRP